MTTGPACSAATRRASATASSDRPRPGPSATASALSSSSSASGSALTMISGTRPSSTATTSDGAAIHATPAEARSAASAVMSGAPTYPGAPPITSTAPAVYFEPPTAFGQAAASVSAPVRSVAAVAWSASRGMPMSATTTRHAALRPGSTAVPSLRPWKQTVTSARTAAPTTAPVEPSTPDGTSSATIVPIGGRIASMAWATAPRGAPRKPVPRRASTTTSARLSRARRTPSTTAIPRRLAMSWFRRASGGSFRTSPASRHSTSQPAACRWRATTNPSPPLLPAPQTTAALPEPPRRRISSAAARPARSMSTAPGMPSSPMARASTARISSAV